MTGKKGMGAQLHHAMNLHETLQNQKGNALRTSIDPSDLWPHSRKRDIKEQIRTSFDQVQGNMNRLLEQYNRDSLRKTMLKQEELFKDQVQELHRLYQVQKKLVAELRSNELRFPSISNPKYDTIQVRNNCSDQDPQARFWSAPMTPPCTFPYPRFNVQADRGSDEPSSSSQRGFDLERPAEEDNSTSILRHCNDTVDTDLELTLSIGQSINKRKAKEKRSDNLPDAEEECSDPISESSDRESLQRPHWLFQTLSLNRT